MSFAKILTSNKARVIKDKLYALLDQTTDAAVLKLLEEFNQTKNKIEQSAFFAQFKTSGNHAPRTDPALLERMTHYIWIQAELMYFGNQKAALNQRAEQKIKIEDEARELAQYQDDARCLSAFPRSVASAIQKDAERGWPIERSIEILKKMSLQVVGTEHPTDPLSQQARSTLTRVANLLNENQPSEEELLSLFRHLQTVDAIPPGRRSVDVEVSRNIEIVLEKLYDNVPRLIDEIMNAYRIFYGEAAFAEHEEAIWEAIETSIVRVGSWPGFDADGNDNVKAKEMREAIRLHRIRIAEKHASTLKSTICKAAKSIEHEIRETIIDLSYEIYDLLQPLLMDDLFKEKRKISGKLLDQRRFEALIQHYEDLVSSIKNRPEKERNEIIANIKKLKTNINLLIQLTHFSGAYRSKEESDKELYEGDLQEFLSLFKKYRNQIRVDPDDIKIEDAEGQSHLATERMVEQFNTLLNDHHVLLTHYPDLKRQLRKVGVQLKCFGMTYGVGHIRQDSDVFVNSWDAIVADLQADNKFPDCALFKYLQNKPYKNKQKDRSDTDCLEEERRRSEFHKKLQDGSEESKAILKEIRDRHKVKYKNERGFELIKTELDRLELAALHPDMFENIIISNCKSRYASDILGVESLLSIFSERTGAELLQVVPLLETRRDLENVESILADYIEKRIKQHIEHGGSPDTIKDIVIEVMLGFSDTERVSGLPALIAIQFAKENITKLAAKYGVIAKIFYGPGGDPTRGGLKRRDPKLTLQGNGRSNMLNTPASTDWYVENLFYEAHKQLADPSTLQEFTHLPPHMQDWLRVCMKEGSGFYEQLHDAKNGLGQLTGLWLGQGVHWLVSMLNSSSRAGQRGVAEQEGDRTASVQAKGQHPEPYIDPDKPRAITAVQMKEMLRDNLNFIGSYAGLKAIGLEASRQLFCVSSTFRDMVEKCMIGVATRDLSYVAHALFADHPELKPSSNAERKQWANECISSYPALLRDMNIKMDVKDPEKRDELLKMLSRLFAYIEEECEATQSFLVKLNQSVYGNRGEKLAQPTDVLSAYPEWQAETHEAVSKLAPLSSLLAIHVNAVNKGENLDEIHAGLNEQSIADSRLSGVGRVLGNEGAAITACRITPSAYNHSLDSTEIPAGVVRAVREEANIDKKRTLPYSQSVWRLFENGGRQHLDELIAAKVETLKSR